MAAPALVGSAGALNATGINTANTPAYGQNPTAGSILACFVAGSGVTTFPATPSGWTLGPQEGFAAGSITIFYLVATGGDAAPTIAAIASDSWTTQLCEFSGCATSSPLDQSGVNGATSSPVTATAGGADTAAGELVLYGVSNTLGSAATRTQTMALNNGATATDTANNGAVSTKNHVQFGYGITTGKSSADTAQATAAGGTAGLNVAVASFLLLPASNAGFFDLL